MITWTRPNRLQVTIILLNQHLLCIFAALLSGLQTKEQHFQFLPCDSSSAKANRMSAMVCLTLFVSCNFRKTCSAFSSWISIDWGQFSFQSKNFQNLLVICLFLLLICFTCFVNCHFFCCWTLKWVYVKVKAIVSKFKFGSHLFADHQELRRLWQEDHGDALDYGRHRAQAEHVPPALVHVGEYVVDQEGNQDAHGDAQFVKTD